MQEILKVIIITAILCSLVVPILGQEAEADSAKRRMDIPKEIISRIPEGDLTLFLKSRQIVVNKEAYKEKDAFEELGVRRETLARIPSSDLLEFFDERGYIELPVYEHLESGDYNGPPSAKEMLKILYFLIFSIAALIALGMFFKHFRKQKEQEIVLKAIENDRDIPFDLILKDKQQSYLTNASLLSAVALAIVLLSIFDMLPGILATIPICLAAGYLFLRYLNTRTD